MLHTLPGFFSTEASPLSNPLDLSRPSSDPPGTFCRLHFALDQSKPSNGLVTFIISFLAIIPLAALLSYGTEEISLRVGQTLGGLLNATLGNAVELIVAILALASTGKRARRARAC